MRINKSKTIIGAGLFLNEHQVKQIEKKLVRHRSQRYHIVKLNDQLLNVNKKLIETNKYKIKLTFFKIGSQWVLSKLEIFCRKCKTWSSIIILTFVLLVGDQIASTRNITPVGVQGFSEQVPVTVIIGRGGNNNNELTENENSEAEKEKEQKAMEKLKRAAIQKSVKKRHPMSINKTLKGMANLLAELYNNKLSRQILLSVEASVRNPPSRIPRVGIKIDPTQRKFFPPGTISKYSQSAYRASATRTQLMFKKSEEEIRKTSSRRQPPLFKVPIKGYKERTPYASGGQMTGKKIYHKEFEDPTIRKAMGLDNNYLTDENNSLAVLKFIRSVLSCDNLLIRKGTLNYQENVLHIFEPNTRVYMCFEIWNEFNDAFYITEYQRTVENTEKFEDQMRDKNWNGNVGLSREERQVELERQAQARSKKNFRKLFKEYSPTIAPTGKLSNQQINEIPKILSKSLQNQADKLTPEQIEILQRFDTIEKGWQIHLDNQPDNISREDDRRNLWRELDPTEAPSLKQQIDDILGPSLGDVE